MRGVCTVKQGCAEKIIKQSSSNKRRCRHKKKGVYEVKGMWHMRHLNPNCSKESLLSISLDTNTLPLATPASAAAYFTALPSPLLRHAAPRLVAGDANRRRRVVLPLGGSTTLLSLMHRNATPRDQRRRSACNPP